MVHWVYSLIQLAKLVWKIPVYQILAIEMAGQQQQGKMMASKVYHSLDQTLGIGSYGKVCRAKCDDLLCAAKLLHKTLFDPTAQQLTAPQREHRLPMRRFEREWEFLSTIRHPNIVQYMGIYQDPDTGWQQNFFLTMLMVQIITMPNLKFFWATADFIKY